jgi:hypothetical protein
MKKAPSLLNWNFINFQTSVFINGKWVASRPMGCFSIANRVKLAWMVFTGKADALVWPKDQ